ncbi:hypothetical protein PInf_021700 [Phytophthora infestans]|nr:hypothetical protein PInf_021700 [Phytophthora infestans]
MLARLDVDSDDASAERQAAEDWVTKPAGSVGRGRKRYAEASSDWQHDDKNCGELAGTKTKAYDPGISAASPIIDSGAYYPTTGDRKSLLTVVPCDDHYTGHSRNAHRWIKEATDVHV